MLTCQAMLKQIKEGKYAPVYLFFGEEKYLQEELVQQLAGAFLGQDSDFGKQKVDGNTLNLEEVLARLGETELFTERRMLIVDNPPYLVPSRKEEKSASDKEGAKDSLEKDYTDLLEGYLKQQAPGVPNSMLVFLAVRPDRRKRFYKLIDKHGTAVECSPLKGEALASWIWNKVARLGKKIDRAAIDRLLLAGETNLHYLSGELEKYAAYLGENHPTITAQTVDTLFSGDIQGDIFKLSDAMAEGGITEAHNILELLIRRREKPLLIFFMLVRHYRLLLLAHCLLEEGLSQSEYISALEVHPFVARKLRDQAAIYNRYALEEVLIALQKADMQIKTGQIEPMQALRLTLNRIDYVQDRARKSIS